jgi:hypothetical protein
MKIYIGIKQVKIYNFLNRLFHEVLGFAPTMTLIIFFYEVDIFPLLDKLPQKMIPYPVIE